MCIELGLHRRDSLFKVVTDEEERSNAIKLFWSIYVLDRKFKTNPSTFNVPEVEEYWPLGAQDHCSTSCWNNLPPPSV